MKFIIPFIILSAASAFPINLNRDEIMGLSPKERTELYMKLPEGARKQYADSLRTWAQQYIITNTAKMAEEYKQKVGEINSLMKNNMLLAEKLASQVGFSMIAFILLFMSSLILGILAFKRQSNRLFKTFIITSSLIAGLYAFTMFVVF